MIEKISEFEKTVDSIYGVYLDAVSGFAQVKKIIEESQIKSIQQLKNTHPESASVEFMDTKAFVYGDGPPPAVYTKEDELHRCTQGEFKCRNSKGGANYKFIGNMSLISIYQYWEDRFRSEIANECRIEKNDLIEPIMGDLRLLRRSIIHHGGIALEDIEKCEILTWFKAGDEIFIDEHKFKQIIKNIKLMIQNMKAKPEL